MASRSSVGGSVSSLLGRGEGDDCVVVDPPGEGGWHGGSGGGSGVWLGKSHRCWGVDSGAVALVAQHILLARRTMAVAVSGDLAASVDLWRCWGQGQQL